MKVKSESEVAQSCPTLSDPLDCSLPGSSVHGIFQARVLEWEAIAFSGFYAIGVALTDKMLDGWLSHLKQARAGRCTLKGRMMACKRWDCFSVQECDEDRMPLNRENVILRFQLRRNVETYCQGGFSHV